MKLKFFKWAVPGILAVLVLSVLFGCKKKEDKVIEDASAVDTTYKVYYVKADGSGIEGVSFSYSSVTTQGLVEECLKGLAQTPDEEVYTAPISGDCSLQDYEFLEERRQVNLYFDASYENLEKAREVLVRAAIVKTLTQFDSLIDYVEFYVGGELLKDSDGYILRMMQSDFVESTSADLKNLRADTLKLYFASSDGYQLVEEDVYVHYQNTASVATVVMESLISGPLSASLNRTFPEDTKLNSVKIEDQICYVDMNQRFLDAIDGIGFDIKIYSVVNSLCALEDIDGVQILIDGQKVSTEEEGVGISDVLTRNDDIVMKTSDTPPAVENGSQETEIDEQNR